MSTESSKAECPVCLRVFSLTKDGRLRAHGYRMGGWYATGARCSGSGELPVRFIGARTAEDGHD